MSSARQWQVGDRVGIWQILDRYDTHDDAGRKRKKVPKQKNDSNRIIVCTLKCTTCGTCIRWRYRGLPRISPVVACGGSHTAGGEIMLLTTDDEASYLKYLGQLGEETISRRGIDDPNSFIATP